MALTYDENGNPTDSGADPLADRKASVAQWYRQYLGREGGADEINGWASNPNFGSVENAIRGSQEAKQYGESTSNSKTQTAAAPPANSAQAWNREQFRDQWMGTGTDVNAQNALLSQYGITLDKSGRGLLPSGETMDLRIGANAGQNLAGWTGVAGGGAKYGQDPGAGGDPSAMGSASGSIGTGSGVGMGNLDPRVQQLIDLLTTRATQGLNIDRTDPVIRQQADAYSANAERARRNYLADTAEKAGPYANLQGEARVTAEKLGQDTGAFEAQLMGRELQSRRDEIAQALQSMQGLLTQEQQLSLSKELALLNNAIEQQRVGLQGRSLDLQGTQMNQQNDQFLRSLGLQEADRASYWDALRQGLLG